MAKIDQARRKLKELSTRVLKVRQGSPSLTTFGNCHFCVWSMHLGSVWPCTHIPVVLTADGGSGDSKKEWVFATRGRRDVEVSACLVEFIISHQFMSLLGATGVSVFEMHLSVSH